ncbi:serine esterase [Sinomonas notoginsengisoli]
MCSAVLPLLGGCDGAFERRPAALLARPQGIAGRIDPGESNLGSPSGREVLLYAPASLAADGPSPLILSLHGAGNDARGGLFTQALADRFGALVLAPSSAGRVWDRAFGPDLTTIDMSLQETFRRARVDPSRIAVAGFSAGASYALGLGLANGSLFSSIMAFSPGSIPDGGREGWPRVFISHGVGDERLPIDQTSRRIAPVLRGEGYEVDYEEFDGGHTVPPEKLARAGDWLGW